MSLDPDVTTFLQNMEERIGSKIEKVDDKLDALAREVTQTASLFDAHNKEDDRRFSEMREDTKATAKKSAGWVTAIVGVVIGAFELLGYGGSP